MEEETLRKMAIEQYLRDKDPVSIYREMGRSKKWFFKWLHRYQSGDVNWYRDQSRAPQSHPHQISPEMRKLIVNIRRHLEENPYAQVGTSAIKWEFKKFGIIPPSDPTINRILKKEGLVKKNSLYPQRSRIPLFHRTSGNQPYPSGGSHGTPIHQERRAFLFAQCHGPHEPPSLYPSPTKERRPGRGFWVASLLEEHGDPGLSPGRQRTLLPGKQSLPSFPWHRSETLSVDGGGGHLYPYRRTLA